MSALRSRTSASPKSSSKKSTTKATRHLVSKSTITSWTRKSERLEREVRDLKAQIEKVTGVRKPEPDSLAAAKRFGAAPGVELSTAATEPVLVQIAASAEDVLGVGPKALEWLHNAQLPQFAGLTPAQLVQQGLTHALVETLDEMRFGARG